jgi:hypothetical protein
MAQISGGKVFSSILDGIAAKIGKATTVEIGFMEDATYPGGTQVALVAAVQEFGSSAKNIPPRPFFRNMIAAKQGAWPDTARKLLVDNGYDAALTLQQLGQGIKGQLQESITSFHGAPLSPVTIKAKGFDKALIDTGHMLNSVDYRVI